MVFECKTLYSTFDGTVIFFSVNGLWLYESTFFKGMVFGFFFSVNELW